MNDTFETKTFKHLNCEIQQTDHTSFNVIKDGKIVRTFGSYWSCVIYIEQHM